MTSRPPAFSPNALSALSEVMNGYWLTANSPRASALFQLAGAPIPLAKSGPAFPFLVGAANTKGVTFGDQRSVYAMMGRALRSWTTDPAIQVELIEYTKANWQSNAAGNAVKADVVMRDHQPVFDAFGYAEVSLGVDRLRAILSRASGADRRRHGCGKPTSEHARQIDKDDARPAGGDRRRPRPPPPRAVPPARSACTSAATTTTRSSTHFDRPMPMRAPRHGTDTALQLATGGVRDLDANGWTARIMEVLARRRRGVRAPRTTRSFASAARRWADDAPQRMIDITSTSCAAYGLPDGGTTVSSSSSTSWTSVCSELAEEAEEYRRLVSSMPASSVAAELAAGRAGSRPSTLRWKRRSTPVSGRSGGYQGEAKRPAGRDPTDARVRRRIRRSAGPVDPILPTATSTFAASSATGWTPPIVTEWPDRAVPESMIPPRNEQLVIDLDDFAELFDNARWVAAPSSERTRRQGDRGPHRRHRRQVPSARGHRPSSRRPRSRFARRGHLIPPCCSVERRRGPPPRSTSAFVAERPPATAPTHGSSRQGTAFDRFLNSNLRVVPRRRRPRRSGRARRAAQQFRVAL